ncbi:Fosfomycin resistance protein AbaF (plasmid) [Rhodococcus ruber]|uniref:MFS transporter n=1 Tax=Rhodococcus ruber TaxID=1830 RepID=UPI00315D3018
MASTESITASPQRSMRGVVTAALSASTLEWYDFYIYGTAAALVFNDVFFPSVNPTIGTLAAFATFGVGFLFRPLGGLIFGHFGDTHGRKTLLVAAMLLMGISTFLIGVLPTYEAIGLAAPVLLVILRALQGLAVGGQYGGAMLLVTENAPAHRRGFYGSFSHIGPSLAVILSNVIFLVVVAFSDSGFLESWGWRIPFLLSAVVVAAGLYMQLRLEDTAEFTELRERQRADAASQGTPARRERSPIITALMTHPKQLLQAGGMILVIQVYYYVLIVFTISYATSNGISRSTALVAVLASSAVTVLSIPYFAALSDRIGRKKILLWSCVATTLTAFPFVLLLGSGNVVLLTIAVVIPGLTLGALYGPMAAFYYEMFSAEIRYSGASIGYQLGAVLGGGFAPLIATSLLAATGTILSVGAYITVAGLISIWAIASTASTPATR